MYFTGPSGVAYAIDAKNGRQLWKYTYPPAEKASCFPTEQSNADLRSSARNSS